MSHPPVIDGFEFASAGATQQGVLPLSVFPRLRDVLATASGEVAYAVRGTRDARGRPSLQVSAEGTLQLRCQRCLEPLAHEVSTESLLVLAASQAEIDAEPLDAEAPDRVVAGKEMSLRDLVEDELILALPYAPRHEGCEAAHEGMEAARETPRASPFAGLREKLKH
jgi:uncharacterized protein